MRWLRRRHQHDWRWVGYGGCGWSVYQCATCDERDIG